MIDTKYGQSMSATSSNMEHGAACGFHPSRRTLLCSMRQHARARHTSEESESPTVPLSAASLTCLIQYLSRRFSRIFWLSDDEGRKRW